MTETGPKQEQTKKQTAFEKIKRYTGIESIQNLLSTLKERFLKNSSDLQKLNSIEAVELESEAPPDAESTGESVETGEILENKVEYNGRDIYLEAHFHIHPLASDELSRQALLPESKEGYSEFINGTISENESMLTDYKSRVAKIINTIRSQGISAFGLECTPNEADNYNPEESVESLNLLSDMMSLHGIEDYEAKAKVLFLILHGEVAFISATQNELVKDIDFVGLEHPKRQEEGMQLVAESRVIRRQMLDRGSNQHSFRFSAFDRWDKLCIKILDDQHTPDEQDISEILDGFPEESDKELAKKGIETNISFVENSKRRDKIMSYRIKQGEGDMVIILGAQHIKGVKKDLEK